MTFPRQFSDSTALLTPSRDYFAITPNDSTNFTFKTRSIRVGVGGDVVAVREDGTAVTFKNCFAGEVLPIVAVRVNATNTTASQLVGL
ncbi:hypothetical protein UFOVP653_58 [uncultured Caudovirales phage]|uniref:Uncharacterized protein n=1 Tax=uncultured Caudovirales phage TaxID=2100421 RepID=A0A6J5N811_9CAUD|nr:hypothetical protein UFOVP653_58 [uncultured Caudovirales phage]